MALTDASERASLGSYAPYLRWPTAGVNPAAVWADYDPIADELLVYFDKPAGSTSVAIGTPDRDYVYLLVDDDTDTVVGIHVDDLRVWVAAANPRWAPLATAAVPPEQRREAISALIADAAGLFALHGAGGA